HSPRSRGPPRLRTNAPVWPGDAMKVRLGAATTWRLLAALPLASGAALIVHVLSGVSLGATLLAAGGIVFLAGLMLWRQLSPHARLEVRRRAVVGTLAGLAATGAYDSVRWALVTVFRYTFWPFDIFSIFGQAIAGGGLPAGVVTGIGVLYHYLNGVLFALAYTILFGRAGWWVGILWALGLEALMLSVYPGWLHPQAFGESLGVSLLGPVGYGPVLGLLTQRTLVGGLGWPRRGGGGATAVAGRRRAPKCSATAANTYRPAPEK